MNALETLKSRIAMPGRHILAGLPNGLLADVLPSMVSNLKDASLIHVCLDDQHLAALEEQLAFHAPDLEIVRFPAWDCLPYDRVSPSANIVAARLSALSRFLAKPKAKRPPTKNNYSNEYLSDNV